jgi:hypothetical protein
MTESPAWLNLLRDANVRDYLTKAWNESFPDSDQAHEEGGFIVTGDQGAFDVVRWDQGEFLNIVVPPHRGCRINGQEIVASFHTHPHSTKGYDQLPTDTDIRAVKHDRQLKGLNYVGEFVISLVEIYLIDPKGHVSSLGGTAELLGWNEVN